MRKKSKSAAILAVVMAMTLAGSSAVYAEENSSAKTAETDDNEKEDTRAAENEPAPCNEGEHELIESKLFCQPAQKEVIRSINVKWMAAPTKKREMRQLHLVMN